QEVFVLGGEPGRFEFIQQLEDANDLAVVVFDGKTHQRLGGVFEFLVETAVKIGKRVGIVDVDDLAGLGNASGNALAEGYTDLAVVEAGGDNGPEFFVLAVDHEDGAAVGFYLGARNLQDQFQKFGEVEC